MHTSTKDVNMLCISSPLEIVEIIHYLCVEYSQLLTLT